MLLVWQLFLVDHIPAVYCVHVCWLHYSYACFILFRYERYSKSLETNAANHNTDTSYFVTFYHRLQQVKCTWSNISPKLRFHCRTIVDLVVSARHLPCTQHIRRQQICPLMNSLNLGNKCRPF